MTNDLNRPGLRVLLVLGALALGSACGPDGPYCGLPADITNRLTVYCPSDAEDPVCDFPGMEAHYEDTASGLRLVGGELATCDTDDNAACPPGTVGEPRCLPDPEL